MHTKGHKIVCPSSFVDMLAEVKLKLHDKKGKAGSGHAATFIVNQVNFLVKVKVAFQRVKEIWTVQLVSNVPIRMTAYWEELDQNVKLEVFSLRGAKLVDEMVPKDGKVLDYEIAIGNLAPGTYMVKLTEKRSSVIKK